MELEGYIEFVSAFEETPYVRYVDFYYGFMGLKHIVVWTDVNSDQLGDVLRSYYQHVKVGIRYDRETKELLAIWKGN